MIRIQLDLQNLTVAISDSAQRQIEMRDEVMAKFERQQDVSQMAFERIRDVEEMLNTQIDQRRVSQSRQLGPLYQTPHLRARQSRDSSSNAAVRLPNQNRPEGLSVLVMQYTRACRSSCQCDCHKPSRIRTPELVNQVLGRMFIGYAGFPLISPKCDSDDCEKSQHPHVDLQYWFPPGFV
jgi:hypothetical protein